ncbi:hypothetical protein [Halopelagius longus]|uniref:Uncharacterized protein n=1 Tax=Halopelagius longus TaxID=1236180 RepID=A0A1H1GLU7_9EURY|nr:hypothetical protein [Halopelagius longus]SDR14101.1 hypothetical protein SAMN05216278_3754 [Halopelagius longus]
MDEEDFTWLIQEFNITAERASDRGISPKEFVVALEAYGDRARKQCEEPIPE